MTIRKLLFGTAFLMGAAGTAQAQYTKDVLLFSQGDNGGTARFKAMGNASTALGGDISSITSNPAGLGYFNQSDISVTGRYLNNKNKTEYFGQNSNSSKNNFNLDNAGIVFHLPTYRNGGNLDKGWLNFNVGIAYNRNYVYNNLLEYRGVNNTSSITNAYSDRLSSPDGMRGWGQELYNNSLLFDVDPNNAGQYRPISVGGLYDGKQGFDQVNSILEKGSKSESVLSFGANYSNKLYLGAALGFTAFTYDNSSWYTEYGQTMTAEQLKKVNPSSDFLDPKNTNKYKMLGVDYELFDDYVQASDGTGIDFKLGMIYKFTPTFSMGFTAKTPTFMSIRDESYSNSEFRYFNKNENTSFKEYRTSDDAGYSYLEYNMNTPYRLSLGASQLFSRGLLTADVEWVDYGAMRFRDAGTSNKALETAMNQNIKENYQGAFNARIGGEILFDNVFSGRAGFNYSGNPYKNADYTNYTASLGIGAKLGRGMYIDLTGAYNAVNYKENPYLIAEDYWNKASPAADIKNQRTNIVLTIGSKF
ncbi:OmpP1/FadL family transporter [Sphingobacterium thalpophilum]|uniref:OmpP1/FadL family transporter n=1 Tax=Sphingobacterium thalpophilum TaxID=259 RepID=UPI0037DA2B3B